jgi:hypothetical protein
VEEKGDAVMLQVVYRNGLKQAGPLRHAAEEATRQLEEIVGDWADTMSAEWERGEDSDFRPVLVLRLFDNSDSVTAVFDPKELTDLRQVESRLRFLWGDFLQMRLGKHLKILLGSEGGKGDT